MVTKPIHTGRTSISRTDKISIQDVLPLIILLLGYGLHVLSGYATMPIRSDELGYTLQVEHPEKHLKILFRFFSFYFAKIFSPIFSNSLETAACVSFFYSAGTVTAAWYLIRNVSGNLAALIGAITVCSYPTMIYQATWFGSDLACLFFGMSSLCFALNKYMERSKPDLNVLLSGFFLVGSIYSKQSGICFLLPVVFLLIPQRSTRVWICFAGGVISALLFMSVCNAIWLNDFFYHISLSTYWDFLGRFHGQLTEDSAERIVWTDTFARQMFNDIPRYLLVYLISFLIFITIGPKTTAKKKWVSFSIATVGFMSILVHEAFHVGYVGLNLRARYHIHMVIPLITAFSILLPVKYNSMKKRFLSIEFGMSIFFMISIFWLRIPTYYSDLSGEWNLSISLIHVFSFWFFLAAFALVLCTNNHESERRHLKIFSKPLQVVGMLGMIIYIVLWGNIESAYEFQRRNINSRLGNVMDLVNLDTRSDILLFNLHPSKTARKYIEYIYLLGKISREEMVSIKTNKIYSSKESLPVIDAIMSGNYGYLLTRKELKTFVTKGQEKGLSFNFIQKYDENNLFKINRLKTN